MVIVAEPPLKIAVPVSVRPYAVVEADANDVAEALKVAVPPVAMANVLAQVIAKLLAALVLKVVPWETVTALNCVEAFPRDVVPARSKVMVPDEWV